MARYGRDMERGWQGGGGPDRGFGGGWGGRPGRGGMGSEGRGGMYGGMRSDANFGARERSGFGAGGGAYDTDYGMGGGGGGFGGGDDEIRGMRAADVMTDNPETVTSDTPLMEAARKMRELDVGIIPVVESENSRRLRGVITDRDIAVRAVAEGKDANATTVGDVMTTDLQTCNKNDSLRDVLGVMEREQVRRVPITDREGRLVGIIAQADLAVDYAGNDSEREMRVEDTIERISEPGRPEGRMAARGRGAQGGSRSGQQDGNE